MTRKPAAASGSISLRHPYQNSGKPWRRTTTAPSFGPAATACNAISPFWKASVSRKIDPENDFRIGQPARFVPVGFFREGAHLACDIEFWRAREFAFLSNDGFQDCLGIAHGNADAGGHDKGQIEKRAPPSLGAKLSLRDEIEAGDRARRSKE